MKKKKSSLKDYLQIIFFSFYFILSIKKFFSFCKKCEDGYFIREETK